MNLWSVAALGIGSMVGAGIFALLGQAALVAGGETYIAFIIGGAVAALSGYSYARLAARYPKAGGISEYFDQAFGIGRTSGTLALIYLVTLAITVAMVAAAFGAYAAPLFFGTNDPVWVSILASGIVILLTALNIGGTVLVGPAELLLVVVKLVILTGLMIAGASSAPTHHLVEHQHTGLFGLVASVGLTFFAYAGYGMMANAAGSVAHPERTIPRAIWLAIGLVAVLYVGLAIVVLQSVSPDYLAHHADIAVAEAARPVFGHFGVVAVSVGALLATASAINATLFSAIQIATALARSGRLPRAFDRQFWRNGTQGLMLSVVAILMMVNFFDLGAIANMASATFLIAYLAVYWAHWRLADETHGSRTVIAVGAFSMGIVLLVFLWSIARSQPWSIAMIAVFVIFSALVEIVLVKRAVAIAIVVFGVATVLPLATHAQGPGGSSTGQFQIQKGVVTTPKAEPTDFTAQLFSDYNKLFDDYDAFKSRLSTDYNVTYSLQSTYFLQSAAPYGGKPVSLFVYSPTVNWTPFSNTEWGGGQFTVSFTQHQYWSGTNTGAQQAHIGTITAPNDWSSNGYTWNQVSYTQTLPRAMNWLSVTVGQFGIGGFDGDLYAGNAQTNFVSYALAQNATQTYPNAGLGAYLTATVANTTLSFSGGFQGGTDVSGEQISSLGFQTGKYATFGNVLWAPKVPGLGAGSYNFLVYYQPSVPMQPGQSTGVSFAMSQALSKKYGIFLRANYASGAILQMTSSFAGGGIVNDPFGRHPNDQLGLGVFLNRGNSTVIGGSAVTPRLWEYGTELYFNYTLVKGLQITPDAAVILNPVLAPTHGAAYIFTLRLTSYL